MGQFTSDYVDNPDDDDDFQAPTAPPSPSPSPITLSSIAGGFVDLPIRAQFGYIKPVLSAILNEQYPPAKERHDNFMKGGKTRAGLGLVAGLRGTIPPNDITKLHKYLSDWCLRDEMRAPVQAEEMAKLMTDMYGGQYPLEHIENTASSSVLTKVCFLANFVSSFLSYKYRIQL